MTVSSLSKIAIQVRYSVDFVDVVWESVLASLISQVFAKSFDLVQKYIGLLPSRSHDYIKQGSLDELKISTRRRLKERTLFDNELNDHYSDKHIQQQVAVDYHCLRLVNSCECSDEVAV